MLTSQSPAGGTMHRVYGKGPGTGGAFELLSKVSGQTDDSQSLQIVGQRTWPGLQVMRVEMVNSPSWVGWREIQVYQAD
jgi:hypothetical protein